MFGEMGLYWFFAALVVSLGRSNVNGAVVDVELPMLTECFEAYGMSPDTLDEMIDNPPEYYYCIVECFYKKNEIIDEQGMFNPDKLVKTFKRFVKNGETSSRYEAAAKDCSKVINGIKIQDGGENCEKVRLFKECLDEYKDIFE